MQTTDSAEVPEAGQPEVAQVLQPYGVGIDTHSKFIAVCVLRNNGGVVDRHERQFKTDWPSMRRARDWVTGLLGKAVGPEGLNYCIESTGTYHLPIIRAFGGQPCVVNPLLAGPTRRKTDVLDARLLAHHSITGLWPKSFMPSEQGQQLRVLWAARGEAVMLATRASNRLNNTILRFGHTLGAAMPLRSSEGQALVEAMCEGGVPGLDTIAPEGLPEAVRPVVRGLLEGMREQIARAKRATAAAKEFVVRHRWPTGSQDAGGRELLRWLESVPGVGAVTSLTWLSEVCDPRRFKNAKQVAAYCGCDPSVKVSAGKVTNEVRRKGNTRLHWALLSAASTVIIRQGDALGDWARALAARHRKGGYRKAMGAVARRIAHGLWEVHMRGEAFSYSGYHLERSLPVEKVPIETMGLPACDVRRLAAFKWSTEAALVAARPGGANAVAKLPRTTVDRIRKWSEQHRARAAYSIAERTEEGGAR
jgi:transposase